MPAELVEAGVVVQEATPEPLGPDTDHVTPPRELVGATPAEPVTVAVKLIVDGITPVSLSVRTTDGVTLEIRTVVGAGAVSEE